jgi:hypothetical protein
MHYKRLNQSIFKSIMSDLPYYFRSHGALPLHVWRVWAMDEPGLLFCPDNQDTGIQCTYTIIAASEDRNTLRLYQNAELGIHFTEQEVENMPFMDTIAMYVNFNPSEEQLRAMGLETASPHRFSTTHLPYISEDSKLRAFQKFQRQLQNVSQLYGTSDHRCDLDAIQWYYYIPMTDTNRSAYEAFWTFFDKAKAEELSDVDQDKKQQYLVDMRNRVLKLEEATYAEKSKKLNIRYGKKEGTAKAIAFFKNEIVPYKTKAGDQTDDAFIKAYFTRKTADNAFDTPASDFQLQCLADYYHTDVCIVSETSQGQLGSFFIEGAKSTRLIHLQASLKENIPHYDLLQSDKPTTMETTTLWGHFKRAVGNEVQAFTELPGMVFSSARDLIIRTHRNIADSMEAGAATTSSRFVDRTAL